MLRNSGRSRFRIQQRNHFERTRVASEAKQGRLGWPPHPEAMKELPAPPFPRIALGRRSRRGARLTATHPASSGKTNLAREACLARYDVRLYPPCAPRARGTARRALSYISAYARTSCRPRGGSQASHRGSFRPVLIRPTPRPSIDLTQIWDRRSVGYPRKVRCELRTHCARSCDAQRRVEAPAEQQAL